jgi:hypothetical protein
MKGIRSPRVPFFVTSRIGTRSCGNMIVTAPRRARGENARMRITCRSSGKQRTRRVVRQQQSFTTSNQSSHSTASRRKRSSVWGVSGSNTGRYPTSPRATLTAESSGLTGHAQSAWRATSPSVSMDQVQLSLHHQLGGMRPRGICGRCASDFIQHPSSRTSQNTLEQAGTRKTENADRTDSYEQQGTLRKAHAFS